MSAWGKKSFNLLPIIIDLYDKKQRQMLKHPPPLTLCTWVKLHSFIPNFHLSSLPSLLEQHRTIELVSVCNISSLPLLPPLSSPAPVWGPFPRMQSFMNFSSMHSSHRLQLPSGHIYLLQHGVLYMGFSVFWHTCSPLQRLKTDKLVQHGLLHRLQENLFSSTWSTSSSPSSFSDLCRAVSNTFSSLLSFTVAAQDFSLSYIPLSQGTTRVAAGLSYSWTGAVGY